MGNNNNGIGDAADAVGPVAGETLKDAARWPGYGLIAIGVVALAMSLTGFAVGRTPVATLGTAIATLAFGAGVIWQVVEHRRLRTRHGSGTPERPEDAAPLSLLQRCSLARVSVLALFALIHASSRMATPELIRRRHASPNSLSLRAGRR